MMRAYRFLGVCIVLAIMAGGAAEAANRSYRIRKLMCQMDDSCPSASGGSGQLGLAVAQGNPAAMDIAGGSSPGENVVFAITNTGGQTTGALTVSLTGDTGNFSKTADTCNGQVLAASANCSITIRPVATADGSYTGTLQVSATPGGTVSRALSGTASGFVVDPGTVMPDGMVYVGLSPDGNLPMYVTRCDAGMTWDGAACTGVRATLTWGAFGIATGIIDVNTGKANTSALIMFGGTDAAQNCYDLNLHGHTDWYLPAKDELNVIYQASVAAGGTFRASFATSGQSSYWPSTEPDGMNTTVAWYQNFADGYQDLDGKGDVLSVRCARTDGDIVAPTGSGLSPADDAVDVAVDANLVITFSENVQIGIGDIEIHRSSDGQVLEAINVADAGKVGISDNQATINPAAAFANGEDYYVTVAAGAFTDMSDNPFAGIAGTTAWNFTTVAAVGGSIMPDGTVYAGLSPDGNVPMYVTRCDAGMSWNGTACAGTRSGISWDNGASNWVVTGVNNTSAGEANTAMLAGLVNVGAPYPAAQYCENLSLHGHSDWYLPAKDELTVVYTNKAAIGGFDLSGAHVSGWYWSSSEYDDSTVWPRKFDDGIEPPSWKFWQMSIRCVRKEGAALGMGVQQGDPAAMDIAGGSSPGSSVVFTITNSGEAASGTLAVSLTGDTGNFDKTADTCNGQALAASASCSITVQPIATADGSYTGMLEVSGAPGGTVSRALSGTASGFVLACGGSPVPGCLAADGTVYVGLSPDGNVPMYVTRCDAGMSWDGTACTGTRDMPTWGTYGTTTGATDVNAGEVNTNTLATDYSDTYAAKYCHDLDLHGRIDWYLPSMNELNAVYQASVAAGGTFRESFDLRTSCNSVPYACFYWSSSEYNSVSAWGQYISTGIQLNGAYTPKYNSYSVRCARKDSAAALGMTVPQGDPAAMDIAGGSSPGSDVVFTITNTGETASGTMTVSLTGDTGNFNKTADTCNGMALAASASCSITIRPIAVADGGYSGTLQVTGTPGGTVSRALSGTASGFAIICGGSPVAGCIAADGTVYAGLSPDGNVPMYVTRCDAEMTWDGSQCTGTRSAITWNNGASNMAVTGVTNVNTGEANTTALAVLSDAGSPYQAARYCDNLDMQGKMDWYLPALAELNVIYLASVAAGGTFRASFDLSGSWPSGYYWSSSEDYIDGAFYQRLSDGYQYAPQEFHGLSVRCSRKDSAATLGMTVPQGNPATMNITGGSSPGENVVFTITNTGQLASGTLTVSLTGDTGNFSKTADTCNGQMLAASASCSITVQPVATTNGSYSGTLTISGNPGGTVNQSLSGTAIGFVVDPACAGSPGMPGTVLADGSVYVGCSPDGNVPMYTTRCDAGMDWDGSSCTGARGAFVWGTFGTTTGVTNTNTGESNTVTLVNNYGVSPAVYCYNLVAYGQNDWYLPAKYELNVIYLASVAAGGSFRASFSLTDVFPEGWYWSSSENNDYGYGYNNAWTQRPLDGTYGGFSYKYSGNPIRCTRR